MYLDFICKGNRQVKKEIRIEQFLADLIQFKLKNCVNKTDFIFSNGDKERLLLPNKYCKSFDSYFVPSMCRIYRATIELQNAFEILIEKANTNETLKQLIIRKLILNLNKNGCYLLNEYFMQAALTNITDLLSHASEKYITIISSDLEYIDDRIVFDFFKYFLDEKNAKLFYYRVYSRILTEKIEPFDLWSKKHYWAFDEPDIFPKEVFQTYFYKNQWIDEI